MFQWFIKFDMKKQTSSVNQGCKNLQMKSEFGPDHYQDIRLWLFVTLCDKSIFSLLWNCTVVLYQYTIRRYTHFPSGNMQRTGESILQILSIITNFWYDHLQKYLKPTKTIIDYMIKCNNYKHVYIVHKIYAHSPWCNLRKTNADLYLSSTALRAF